MLCVTGDKILLGIIQVLWTLCSRIFVCVCLSELIKVTHFYKITYLCSESQSRLRELVHSLILTHARTRTHTQTTQG